MSKSVTAIIQARMGSSRFPGKVLKSIIDDKSSLDLMIERVGRSAHVTSIIVATTTETVDDFLAENVARMGVECFRGDPIDVYSRFRAISKQNKPDIVVRLTGDCPFVDPEIIDILVEQLISGNHDYCSNVWPPTWPDGLDVEVIKTEALLSLEFLDLSISDREHVTTKIRQDSRFDKWNYVCSEDWGSLRLTLDDRNDLSILRRVAASLGPRVGQASYQDIVNALLSTQSSTARSTAPVSRGIGSTMTDADKIWARANAAIANGAMMLSKHKSQFDDEWPSHFTSASGISLSTACGRHLVDVSTMGIGCCSLGYADREVDAAVVKSIGRGSFTTLNCLEEIELAELLLDLHSWADKARFARTGGEANAVAIRLARAASGKSKVAVCGYHGWHDWYLASTLPGGERLTSALQPGVAIKGVPEELQGMTFGFEYGDLMELTSLAENHDLAAVKMEVARDRPADPDFLCKVRQLCSEKNICLIFDECTSGFRESYGGLHLNYGVTPDLVVLGKALGNGYPITAILGKSDVMDHAEYCFLSSTFWTERVGPTAALATLKKMAEEKSYSVISSLGRQMKQRWADTSERYGIEIEISGIDALARFKFRGADGNLYRRFLIRNMLQNNILASNVYYPSTVHQSYDFALYEDVLDTIFHLIESDSKQFKRFKDLHRNASASGDVLKRMG